MGWMSSNIPQPKDRDYAAETQANLETQIKLAPELYASEASQLYGQPAYARLGMRTLEESMFGSGGQGGMLDLYGRIIPQLADIEAGAASRARQADVEDVEAYGQRATSALLGSDPLKEQLSNELIEQAIRENQAGGILPPKLSREYQQAFRAGAGARGTLYSPASIPQEAVFTTMQAEQLRRGRQQFGQQALAQRQQLTGDPFMQILGRGSGALASAQGVGQQGFAIGQTAPRLVSPESQYAGDIYQSNAQREMAANLGRAQSRAGMMSGLFQGLGAIGGGFVSKCHVAREVYGDTNPKWVKFFIWKETEGPSWFRKLYNKYSEKVARYISDKPRVKDMIRTWMDSKIKGA